MVDFANADTCANCGLSRVGEYCQGCGQRRLVEADRRLGHLLGQFFAAATDLDGRFWRSLRALMFQPGLLSREYLSGRRARWMSPVAIFLLANLVYFFAPGISDFELSFREQMPGAYQIALADEAGESLSDSDRRELSARIGQPHSRWTAALVAQRIDDRDAEAREHGGRYRLSDYARAYDLQNANISKVLIVLHVPFLALALYLLFPSRRWYFAEHFVVALHLFAFLLFLAELVLLPAGWLAPKLGIDSVPPWARLSMLALVLGYFLFALRRVYAAGWLRSALATLALVVVLAESSIWVFRSVQFLPVFALT